MRARTVGLIVVGGLFLAGGAAGQEGAVSARKTALLEQEYALAKTPATYFIFDFAGGTVSLKAKGLVLKEWTAVRAKTWGRPAGVLTLPLVRKTAYRAPQRKDVTPGKAEVEKKPAPKGEDLDILELDKMPVKYTLELPDEIRIRVRLRKKGFAGILGGAGRFFSRTFGRSFKTVVRGLRKKPFTDIELVFNEESAAKNIYWSFFEGQKCILYWPE